MGTGGGPGVAGGGRGVGGPHADATSCNSHDSPEGELLTPQCCPVQSWRGGDGEGCLGSCARPTAAPPPLAAGKTHRNPSTQFDSPGHSPRLKKKQRFWNGW